MQEYFILYLDKEFFEDYIKIIVNVIFIKLIFVILMYMIKINVEYK